MARLKEKQKAIGLRKEGRSYSQIKEILKVGKGTLSAWLKDYPLSEERIRELRDFNEKRIERCRETKRKKKELRLNDFYKQEKSKIFPLNKKELYLAGLFLYWGEGAKTCEARLTISNTDPSIIKFFMFWLEKYWKVPREKLKVQMHFYVDMDIAKEINFWSKELNISKKQFIRPYIKESFIKKINHKRGFGHGTCNLTVGDARLSERVLAGLKVMGEYYIKKK
jgi:hypothetical protein